MKKLISAIGIVSLFSWLSATEQDKFYEFTNYNPDAPESNILEADFKNPQGLAKVSTWWHWIHGNVTKEGIDRDLKEMADKGYGSVRIFQINGSIQGPIEFNSPEYYDMFDYAVSVAKGLGLKMGIHNCEGWSMAGGPWITPETSMKELTWKTVSAIGDGKEQTFSIPEPLKKYDYYEDLAVVAWKSLKPSHLKFQKMIETISIATDETKVVSSAPFNHNLFGSEGIKHDTNIAGLVEYLFDGLNEQSCDIRADTTDFNQYGLTIKLTEPLEISSAYLVYTFQHDVTIGFVLEASDDGVNWKKVSDLHMKKIENLFTFPPVKAQYWRFMRYKIEPTRLVLLGHERNHIMRFNEIELIAVGEKSRLKPSIPDSLKKTAQISGHSHVIDFDFNCPPSESINEKDIYIFRNGINPDGTFTWTLPNDGAEYTIARIGCTTTGKVIHPTTKGGAGLESDKFSADVTKHHFNSYAQKMIDAVGDKAPDTFFLVESDSWEADTQNWTHGFDDIFRERNGYEFFKYFPIFTGDAINSGKDTERFLADFRETTSNLVINNFYGQLKKSINENNMVYEAEPHPGSQTYLFNEMDTFRNADIPMHEIWQEPRVPEVIKTSSGYGGYKTCISTANFYGKKFVSCESATSMAGNWSQTPWNIKGTTDSILMQGFNTLVYHSYTHQPDERAPGWQMEPWGIALNRKMTWWNYSTDFFSYINRSQYMLQQGKFGTEILHFFSDEIPQIAPNDLGLAYEYQYDIINGTGVRDYMRVKNGMIVSPGNMQYKVMFVSSKTNYKIETLRKLKELVEAGATISVRKENQFYFSRIGGEKAEQEWNNLFAEIFRDGSKQIVEMGKGKIFIGYGDREVLDKMNILPRIKFELANSAAGSLKWRSREFKDSTSWFYLINSKLETLEGNVSFRVSGKDVFFWYPESGSTIRVPVYEDDGTYTKVMMSLKEAESVFVVFKDKTNPNRAVQVSLDNAERFPKIKALGGIDNTTVAENFTIAFEVSPNRDRPITEASFKSIIGTGWENLIAFPESMHQTMGNDKHSCATLSVGKNSIAVIEHGSHMLSPVLVYNAPIPDKSKVALIYKDNKASLWVNGKMVAQNTESSGRIVHPIPVLEGGSYVGSIKRFAILDSALDENKIEMFIASQPESIRSPKRPLISFDRDGNIQVEFFEEGKVDIKMADGSTKTFEEKSLITPLIVKGPFDVSFDEKWGAPAKATFENLVSWTENKDEGIKNYSGTAIYTKKINVPASTLKSAKRVYLAIDKVCEVAQVKVNGKLVGTMWRPPYEIEITDFIKSGENTLEIGVANTWANRCLYDSSLPKEDRLTWAISMKTHYPSKDDYRDAGYAWKYGLLPSGLIGNLQLIFTK